MSDSPDTSLFPPYQCHDCGSETGFRSRRRTLVERYILPLLLLRPVRCGECFRRDYRLIFTQVRQRLEPLPRIAAGKTTLPPKRNIA
jgi:hypothetical protein